MGGKEREMKKGEGERRGVGERKERRKKSYQMKSEK